MRLLHYLSLSGMDLPTNKFRSYSINLCRTNKDKETIEILDHLEKKYTGIKDEVFSLIESLNETLKSVYDGANRFQLSEEEETDIYRLSIENAEEIRLFQFEINDKLSKIKAKIEKSSKTQSP